MIAIGVYQIRKHAKGILSANQTSSRPPGGDDDVKTNGETERNDTSYNALDNYS